MADGEVFSEGGRGGACECAGARGGEEVGGVGGGDVEGGGRVGLGVGGVFFAC